MKPTSPKRADEFSVARADQRARLDGHVIEIAGAMSAGKWVPGASHEAMAQRESVTVSAVESWSATAARMLRLVEAPQLAALRARNVARLDDVYEDAETDGNHQARVSAIGEQNKMLGLVVQRHEVTGSTVTAEEWDAWRSAIASELCAGCRERLLERVRAKDPK